MTRRAVTRGEFSIHSRWGSKIERNQNSLVSGRATHPTTKGQLPPPRRNGRGAIPGEVARERGVLPADRRGMGEKIVGGWLARYPQVGDSISHVGRVLKDDGGDHQIQAGSAILLCIMTPSRLDLRSGMERPSMRTPLRCFYEIGTEK